MPKDPIRPKDPDRPKNPAGAEMVLTDDQVRLNLVQQKNRARELQRALKSGAPDALERARTHHPKARELDPGRVAEQLSRLSDAQLILARELGLESWPRLRRHIAEMERARQALEQDEPSPDAGTDTLHIRCGSDIRGGLRTAGFTGDFLEFANPYCHGPVTGEDDLDEIRARFLSESYGLPLEDARTRIRRESGGLAEAGARERVVLWFEHDSYDQLILARILAFFAEPGAARPGQLELICIDRFPAITRFNGLGQLSPAALRMLWSHRQPVTPEMLSLGRDVWSALREGSPLPLFGIAATGTPALPEMAPALLRHLRELPGRSDGLSLTERLSLQALADEPMTGGQLFRKLQQETEPLPYLGDLMYWSFLRDLRDCASPPIGIDPRTREKAWPERRLSLTATGRDLLAGRVDLQRLGALPRWVGGVEIGGKAPPWRWDEAQDRPILAM